jgi:PAS domain S-box-containing protein
MGAITLLVSILLVRTITRPIHHLTDAAMAVERGQPFEPADIKDVTAGRDEIAQLGRTFSSMVLVLQQEITERKRAEEALRLERDNLINILGAMEDGVYIVNQQYDIQYVNPVLVNDFGPYEGRKCYAYFHDREEAWPWCKNQDVFAGKTVRWEWYSSKNQRTYDLIDTPLRNADGSISKLEIFRDITERKRAEEELRKANRALRVLSECNQAVVRATEESDLLHQICRHIVEVGGYRLAWVGFAEQDEAKSVRPVAQTGFGEGYLETLNITWADTERGRGPTGTAIRSGKYCTAKNILTDPHFTPWREAAIQRGYASSVALPLIAEGQTLGALNIYAAEPDAFDADEVKLLTELADDLAFGIVALRTRAERERAEEALRESEQNFRDLVENLLDGVAIVDENAYHIYVNPKFVEITGYSVDELLSMTGWDFTRPEDIAKFKQRMKKRMAGEPHKRMYERVIVRKDGTEVLTEVSTTTTVWQGKKTPSGHYPRHHRTQTDGGGTEGVPRSP